MNSPDLEAEPHRVGESGHGHVDVARAVSRTSNRAMTGREPEAKHVSPRTRAWLEWVALTSIPVRHLDQNDLPIGSASGCLLDYKGRRFLLSAAHAISMRSTGWVMEMESNSRGTEFFRIPRMNYVGEIVRGKGRMREIDLCYIEVPPNLGSIFRLHTPMVVGPPQPRHVFETDLSSIPTHDQLFGFSGHVRLERHGDVGLAGELAVYPGLSFLRSEDDFHVFKLPVPHPGHEHFQGCSGAPIVNAKRELVGIVSGGDADDDTIRGVSLTRYKYVLDFLCSNTLPAKSFALGITRVSSS